MSAVRVEANSIESFSPLQILQDAIRYWWFILLLMLLGSALGWLFHRSNPPVYQAVARFSVSIDFTSTGNMTQYEEDVAYNAIGALLNSDAVIRQVLARAQEEGLNVTNEELRQMAYIDRKVTDWEVRIRSTDSHMAARLASLWHEEGDLALREAYQHALQAAQLQKHLAALEGCLEYLPTLGATQPYCQQADLASLQQAIQEAGTALSEERMASKGLFVGLLLGPSQMEGVLNEPVLFNRNLVILAGAIIGLLLGTALMQARIPARFFESNDYRR